MPTYDVTVTYIITVQAETQDDAVDEAYNILADTDNFPKNFSPLDISWKDAELVEC